MSTTPNSTETETSEVITQQNYDELWNEAEKIRIQRDDAERVLYALYMTRALMSEGRDCLAVDEYVAPAKVLLRKRGRIE